MFRLAQADVDALKDVEIAIVGSLNDRGDAGSVKTTGGKDGILLNSANLMFPPIVTKDSKQANWAVNKEKSGSYEEIKWYGNGKSRQIGLEFEWVTGTFSGSGDEGITQFTPRQIHNILQSIKAYYYGPYLGQNKDEQVYPVVFIKKLYGLFDPKDYQDQSGKSAAFRMMNVNIKYSKEMLKVDGQWFPLHTKLSMDLESVSQLNPIGQDSGGPQSGFTNIPSFPDFRWY